VRRLARPIYSTGSWILNEKSLQSTSRPPDRRSRIAARLGFVTHAAFAAETKQPKAVDPQVFVEDASAQEATGPQGIKHDAGIRPALIDQDAKTSKLFNAEHKPLGFDLTRGSRRPAPSRIKTTGRERPTASPRRPTAARAFR